MKKVFIYFIGIFWSLFAQLNYAVSNDLTMLFNNVMDSDSVTLSLNKKNRHELADAINRIETDPYMQQIEPYSNNFNAFISDDSTSLAVTPSNKVVGYPNYFNLNLREYLGSDNTLFEFNTDVNTRAFNFDGTDRHTVRINLNTAKFMELLQTFTEEFNILTKTPLVLPGGDHDDEDEIEHYMTSLWQAENYFVRLGSRGTFEINHEKERVINSSRYKEVDNKKINNIFVDHANARVFLSNDKMKVYIFIDFDNNKHTALLKFHKSGNDFFNTDVIFLSDLPFHKLNFIGSNNNKVNVTFDLKFLMSLFMETI